MANLISLFRVLLAIYLLLMLGVEETQLFYRTAIFLTLAVIALDGLDGWIARKLHEESKIGSVIDILGDRIVENAYWIVFCANGWVGVWVPLIFMIRSFLTDTLRGIAFADGCTAFGEKSIVESSIGRFLTASRFSRAVYGVAKVVAFITVIACHIPGSITPQALIYIKDFSVGITVLFCVLRAIPVIIEGKKYLVAEKNKKKKND